MTGIPDAAIGIIAEDITDIDCVKILIGKIAPEKHFSFKYFAAHGSGNLRNRNKLSAWTQALSDKKCNHLVLLHDADNRTADELKKLQIFLENILCSAPIANRVICIPVQELEAWLLSDEEALRNFCRSSTAPKLPAAPETIENPKKFLKNLVWNSSEHRIEYITGNNQKLAGLINVSRITAKCRSFSPLYEFVLKIR